MLESSESLRSKVTVFFVGLPSGVLSEARGVEAACKMDSGSSLTHSAPNTSGESVGTLLREPAVSPKLWSSLPLNRGPAVPQPLLLLQQDQHHLARQGPEGLGRAHDGQWCLTSSRDLLQGGSELSSCVSASSWRQRCRWAFKAVCRRRMERACRARNSLALRRAMPSAERQCWMLRGGGVQRAAR